MRLYLSSYRLGKRPDRLVELVGREARVLVTMNALDSLPTLRRQKLIARLAGDLSSLGLEVQELDLRSYFSAPHNIIRDLSQCDLVWANGGNAFTLLMAMTQSGFVDALKDLLENDTIAYGGYSAGAVVAGPTLRGMELVDSADPTEAAPPGYAPEIQWDGMGLVDYSIAPHFQCDHPESSAIETVVQYFIDHDMPYRPLRDGEVILVNGDSEQHLSV